MHSRPSGISPSIQTSGSATGPLPGVLRDFWAEVLQMQPNRGREFFFWFHRVPEGEDKKNWSLKKDSLYDRAMKSIMEHLDAQGFRPLAEAPGQPSVSEKATSAPNAEQSPLENLPGRYGAPFPFALPRHLPARGLPNREPR